jgi:hypothetical protein
MLLDDRPNLSLMIRCWAGRNSNQPTGLRGDPLEIAIWHPAQIEGGILKIIFKATLDFSEAGATTSMRWYSAKSAG